MDPRVLLLFVVAGLVIALLYLRYKNVELRHKERMAALEKGAALPVVVEPAPPAATRVYLLRGLIWLFTGIGLTVCVFFIASMAKTAGQDRWRAVEMKYWRLQRLREQGIPEEYLKQLMNEQPQERKEDPRVAALAGLIPIGVGLAYLVFYSSEEKRMKAPRAPANHEGGNTGPGS